ncbi:MAG: flavin reductase family protein [Clostridia bacterium]|nr:flavin reductase family protein [Clostridia bacterium]
MNKLKLGDKNYLYPSPIVLVGASTNGNPNYMPVSFCSIINRVPAMIAISLNKSHYTRSMIKENGVFSINIPSADMVEDTDYCGLVSGRDVDKSGLFDTFFGVLDHAPMIEECPLNLECKVVHELELEGSNVAIIGQVIETYSDERFLTNHQPDLKKINPILLSMYEYNYYSVGEIIGKAWSVGKNKK